VPAAAVIPAPIAHTKVVAVKKLVVEFPGRREGPLHWATCPCPASNLAVKPRLFTPPGGSRIIYCEKIRVFKAGFPLEYVSMG
jgi:hypothetical protein